MRHLAFTLLLSACASSPDRPEDAVPVGLEPSAILASWYEVSTLLEPDRRCETELHTAYVLSTDAPHKWCGPQSGSCLRSFDRSLFNPKNLLVIVGPSHDTPRWIAHELLHHLSRCTDTDGGFSHADPRVWKDYSKPTGNSVEERAARRLL